MKLGINIDALKSDIGTLNSYRSNLQSRIEELSNSMNSLDSSWDGTAKQAYMTQYDADETTIRDILAALDEFIQTLEYARDEYQNCENAVNSAVKAIRI
ncbi:MAG: WXG100 family type VII secretion target [Lachnospiraceae bacterium]|nr:WXG100 family type VII secretion target [Lachnospiraceae bacterium]